MDRVHAPSAVEADFAPPAELILRYRKLPMVVIGSRNLADSPEVSFWKACA
jgi:hypothetical protein